MPQAFPPAPLVTPSIFYQATPAGTWTIVHNLGRTPVAVSLYDTENHEFGGGWTVVDENTITAVFEAGAIAGVALVF